MKKAAIAHHKPQLCHLSNLFGTGWKTGEGRLKIALLMILWDFDIRNLRICRKKTGFNSKTQNPILHG